MPSSSARRRPRRPRRVFVEANGQGRASLAGGGGPGQRFLRSVRRGDVAGAPPSPRDGARDAARNRQGLSRGLPAGRRARGEGRRSSTRSRREGAGSGRALVRAPAKGDFSAEGYDLCATPRCQVYGGRRDRAGDDRPRGGRDVGEVLLWDGRVADTLFTSTCGGRTAAAAEVFPSYANVHALLSSVECWGEERLTLAAGRPTFAGSADAPRPSRTRSSLLARECDSRGCPCGARRLRARLGLARGSTAPRPGVATPTSVAGAPESPIPRASSPPRARRRTRHVAGARACRLGALRAVPAHGRPPVDRNLRVEEAAGSTRPSSRGWAASKRWRRGSSGSRGRSRAQGREGRSASRSGAARALRRRASF